MSTDRIGGAQQREGGGKSQASAKRVVDTHALKRAIDANHITLTALAAKSDLSPSAITRYVTGQITGENNPAAVDRLARALGLTYRTLTLPKAPSEAIWGPEYERDMQLAREAFPDVGDFPQEFKSLLKLLLFRHRGWQE